MFGALTQNHYYSAQQMYSRRAPIEQTDSTPGRHSRAGNEMPTVSGPPASNKPAAREDFSELGVLLNLLVGTLKTIVEDIHPHTTPDLNKEADGTPVLSNDHKNDLLALTSLLKLLGESLGTVPQANNPPVVPVTPPQDAPATEEPLEPATPILPPIKVRLEDVGKPNLRFVPPSGWTPSPVLPSSLTTPDDDNEVDPFDELELADGRGVRGGLRLDDYERKRISSQHPQYDVANLPMSGKRKGEKPEDMKNGLASIHEPYPWLGHDKRTTFVEVIKMGMDKYGQTVDSVFNEVTAVDGGYDVTMKDNFKLFISHKELGMARKASRFAGADEGMLGDAYFMFGVMCKRGQIERAPWADAYNYVWSDKVTNTYLDVLVNSTAEHDREKLVIWLGLGRHLSPQEIAAGAYEPYVHQNNGLTRRR